MVLYLLIVSFYPLLIGPSINIFTIHYYIFKYMSPHGCGMHNLRQSLAINLYLPIIALDFFFPWQEPESVNHSLQRAALEAQQGHSPCTRALCWSMPRQMWLAPSSRTDDGLVVAPCCAGRRDWVSLLSLMDGANGRMTPMQSSPWLRHVNQAPI